MSSSSVKLKDLVEELHDVAVKWKTLGVQLEIPHGTLKTIEYENRGNAVRALSDMLDEWLKLQLDGGSWRDIVTALKTRSVGEVSLARDIELRLCQSQQGARGGGEGGGGGGGRRQLTKDATLIFLQSMPTARGDLCIVDRCASHYSTLGIFLLNDDDGSRVKTIELANHYNPQAIMMDIFTEWISSGDHTWRILIDNLKMCSLNTLASDIEAALKFHHISS